MADFFAVPNDGGWGANGYLVANGNVYPATSGGSAFRDIPQGNYNYSGPQNLAPNQYRGMSDGRKNPNKGKAFQKFFIYGTGTDQHIKDKRDPRGYRIGIDFHYDGGNPGTAGCIGYQDNAAKDALIADPDKSVGVHYVGSMDEVKAAIEQKLGHKVDWSKVQQVRPTRQRGSGEQSQTKKGKKVKKGVTSVLAGPKKRHTAHVHAALEGGGHVTHGSKSIHVGPQRQRLAGVGHMTTDGSPIANGESSIEFT